MHELIIAIRNQLQRVVGYDTVEVLVEVVLIGLVVWWAVRFLRGTRGASLVKGALVVLAAVYVCIRLLPKEADRGWERIEFLYGKFLLFIFVAAVVAFQPELRRALSQIGRSPLFGGPRRYVAEEIAALVESVSYLARNRIGAIIAIERKVGLGGLTDSGTLIDSDLTPGLLNTLFYPGTPLHDMGVIIQGGRIAAAGCQFPLAESDEVDSSLGSRHRAALGLAQDTDAVVIVVSEETGRISVACEGQLYVGLEPDALRELLKANLVPKERKWLRLLRLGRGQDAAAGPEGYQPPPPRFSRPWVVARLRTAAWVSVVTLLIWVYADVHNTGSRELSATLRLVTPPAANVDLIGSPDTKIVFKIEGRNYILAKVADSLKSRQSIIHLDVSELLGPGSYPGQSTVKLLANVPEFRERNLQIASADPDTIDISLDRLVARKAVPVEFKHSGGDLASAKVRPEKVDVRIPSREASKIDLDRLSLPTEGLDLSKHEPGRSYTEELDILDPPGVEGLRPSQRTASVTFVVARHTAPRTFTVNVDVVVPRQWIEDDVWSTYQLVQKNRLDWTKEITVTGSREDLERLAPNDIRAFVVLTEDDKKPERQWWEGKVHVEFPPGLKVSLAKPVPPVVYWMGKRTETPPT